MDARTDAVGEPPRTARVFWLVGEAKRAFLRCAALEVSGRGAASRRGAPSRRIAARTTGCGLGPTTALTGFTTTTTTTHVFEDSRRRAMSVVALDTLTTILLFSNTGTAPSDRQRGTPRMTLDWRGTIAAFDTPTTIVASTTTTGTTTLAGRRATTPIDCTVGFGPSTIAAGTGTTTRGGGPTTTRTPIDSRTPLIAAFFDQSMIIVSRRRAGTTAVEGGATTRTPIDP